MGKPGRPSKKTPELVEKICLLISQGKSLRQICRKSDFPHHDTVLRWLIKDEEFADKYRRAREIQSDVFVDQMYEEASKKPKTDPLTGRIDPAAVKHQDNKIKTMQWLAMKMNPKKYGDKLDLNHSGNVQMDTVIYEARKRAKK